MTSAVALAASAGLSDLTRLVVTILLSGGLFGAIATLITGRAMARKTRSEARAVEAKLPAEIDSVVVQGAEAAVLTMKAALESAQSRIATLEHEREADRTRIMELEGRIESLRRKVDAAERATTEAKAAGDALRRELDAFFNAQRGRK